MPPLTTNYRARPVPSITTHSLYAANRACALCVLRDGCKGPVPGVGSFSPDTDTSSLRGHRIMLVGEAPGANEDLHGIPFTGAIWEELASLLTIANLTRDDVYLTNAIKCHSKDDPTLADAATCAPVWLESEIAALQPTIIVAMGQTASRLLLNDSTLTLDTNHAIPVWDTARLCWVLPTYHPAAGFYDSRTMMYLRDDFTSLRDLITGKVRERPTDPFAGREDYHDLEVHPEMEVLLGSFYNTGIMAFDTETKPDSSLYCWSASAEEGTGVVGSPEQLSLLAPFFADPNFRLILHNAPYDLVQLLQLGIKVECRVEDTLLMARLLSKESGRLKDLSRRSLGMTMEDYSDLVYPYQAPLSLDYLTRALAIVGAKDYPKPAPITVEEWDAKTGQLVTRQKKPRPLASKITKYLKDLAAGHDPVDLLRNRWNTWRDDGETVDATAALGDHPLVYLAHVPRDRTVYYSARDADATLRNFHLLDREIDTAGLREVYELDRAALPFIAEMMYQGMAVDLPYLADLSTEYRARERDLTVLAGQQVGTPFNPNSGPQVAQVLFKKLRLPAGRKTEGGDDSTDDEVLKPLASRHTVVQTILDTRQMRKLYATYTDPVHDAADLASRVHTDFSGLAGTGRLTAKNPNLMAIPKRSKEGKRVRNAFVSTSRAVQSYWDRGLTPPDDLLEFWFDKFNGEETTLLSADYSQIEVRVMAHEAQVPNLISAFWSGEDVHLATARTMFRDPDMVKSDPRRDIAKGIVFGTIYGITAEGLLVQLEQNAPGQWTARNVEQFLATYREVNPEVFTFMRNKVAEARRYGFVRDMFGRRRFIPEVFSSRASKRNEGERFCANFPIQAGAQGATKIAMGRFMQQWQDDPLLKLGLPLLQVHDQIIVEVPKGVAEEYGERVRDIMEGAIQLIVPTPVDVSYGDRLGELE